MNKALKNQIEWENPFNIPLINPIMRYFSTILMTILGNKKNLSKTQKSFLYTAFMKIKVLTWTQLLYKLKAYLSSGLAIKNKLMNLRSSFCLMKSRVEMIV